MPTYLEGAVIYLNKLGVWSVLIPFIFAFTIAFALLQKSRILGNESAKYNTIISFVFGMMFVYFVDIASLLYFVLYVVLFAIASIMFLLILNMAGIQSVNVKRAIYVVFAFFLLVFASPFIDWQIVRNVLVNSATLMLVIFILAMWVIVRNPKDIKKEAEKEDKAKTEEEKGKEKPKAETGKPGETQKRGPGGAIAPEKGEFVRKYKPGQKSWEE